MKELSRDSSTWPKVEECHYSSCYCEENIHKLITTLVKDRECANLRHLWAVLVSNTSKQVPIFFQKNSTRPEGHAIWDYHVFLIQQTMDNTYHVWDLDTTLPFPCPFKEYAAHALKNIFPGVSIFDRFFRVIPAEQYLDEFASDRSHMLRSNGTYLAAPPAYPCIVARDGRTMTLPILWNMDDNECQIGHVMNQSEFVSRFRNENSSKQHEKLPPN